MGAPFLAMSVTGLHRRLSKLLCLTRSQCRHRRRQTGSNRRLESLEERVLPAITLLIDYSLDNGFFNSAERRAAMESVAQELGSPLNDSLAAVSTGTYSVTHPGTFTTISRTFDVPANAIRVFVSGSALSGSTVGLGGWRTNTGLRNFNAATDFQPYVGYIGFDSDGSTSWNFNDSNVGTNFRAVARHEMLHVLGLGGARSWDALISGSVFVGANARAANGGINVPVSSDGSHFAIGTNSLMAPIIGSLTKPTAIDWGALDDIGWDVTAPPTPPPPPPPVSIPLELTGIQSFEGIGVFRDGVWSLDDNLNNRYDAGDATFVFGMAGDLPVTGDWNGDGLTEVGVFRNGYWYLDVNGNRQFDAADAILIYGTSGDLPIVGDWNGDGADEVGVFREGNWFLDTDRSFSFTSSDRSFRFGAGGNLPVVADFFNEGRPVWGTYQNGTWSIDRNRNGQWDGPTVDATFQFGQAGDRPLGGDWIGPDGASRTTRHQLGVFRNGTWSLDLNEDFTFGAGDVGFGFGLPGDHPVRGAWSIATIANPTPSLRSEIAIFRDGVWTLDANGNGAFDVYDPIAYFGSPGDLPVRGDWNGDGLDEIGVFRNGWWYLDLNGNYQFDGADAAFSFGSPGDQPVVGDWNGDGRSEIGVFRNGFWYLDLNGNRTFDGGDSVFAYGTAGDIAVVGDWNHDGRSDIGVVRNGTWYLDANGSRAFDPGDTIFSRGTSTDRFIVGDWDGDGKDEIGTFRSGRWNLDRNGDLMFNNLDWLFAFGLPNDLPIVGRWRSRLV